MESGVYPAWQRALPLIALVPAAAFPGVGSLGSLIIVLLTLAVVRRSRSPTLALIRKSWLTDLAAGLICGLIAWIVFDYVIDPFLEGIFGPIQLSDFAGVEGNLANYLVLLAVGLIFGGIIEEMIFRGFAIGWGVSELGQGWQVPLLAISSAVFGFTHFYQGWAGVFSTGLTGLMLGLIYIWAGRKLLPAIITHMTINAVGITQIYLGLAH